MTIQCTAFEKLKMIASGPVDRVALKVKNFMDQPGSGQVLVFNDLTGEPVEIDFRGSNEEIQVRLTQPLENKPRAAGRPKLGVIPREVTLLPRHWDWLNTQPSGASVTLRKLVESAMKQAGGGDIIRSRQEAVYKFMSAVTGNLPGYEEAIRSLFARDKSSFDQHIQSWPREMRDYLERITKDAF
jgi:hypothetical protein